MSEYGHWQETNLDDRILLFLDLFQKKFSMGRWRLKQLADSLGSEGVFGRAVIKEDGYRGFLVLIDWNIWS